MTMLVVMNKAKWDSLPDNVKKVIDDNSGMALSEEAGRVYDETRPIMKKLCLKKGMQALQLPPEYRKKLQDLTVPLRNEWIEEMNSKGLPGKAVLDAALKYLNE